MPEEKPTVASLAKRISAVEQALGIKRKNSILDWPRDHKLQAAALLLTAFGLGLTYFLYWKPQSIADDNKNFEDRVLTAMKPTNAKIDRIETSIARLDSRLSTLEPFIQLLVRREMDHAAALPPAEFRQKLPLVNAALNAAKERHITLSATTVTNLRSKIESSSPSAPMFWETTGAMLNYLTSPRFL